MKNIRLWWVVGCLVALAPLARAVMIIYPVDAIDDLWQLGEEEFRQKYAGINVGSIGPSDEGWYVRYRHENLTYLFGPLEDREEARRKKWEMDTVRDAAIKNRPTLNTSQVDFVRFSFSGVYGKAGDSPYGSAGTARISKDGKSGPDGDIDGDGIPNSKDDDMDGDGVANGQDPDADGDGIANGDDDYAFGGNPGPDGNGLASDGRNGPEGDMDGDGIPNAKDSDMDGDGIPNGQDGDADGDGIPNGADKMAYGGKPGGDGTGDQTAGGNSNQAGGQDGRMGQAGAMGQPGQQGGGTGGEGGEAGQQGQPGGQKGRQVASNQRGQRGSQGGQPGGQDGGQQGQQGGQQGQQGQQGGQQGQQGQPGGSPSPLGGGEGGGGGNPLQIIGALLRAILGI